MSPPPAPVYFDVRDTPAFGWLHAGAPDAAVGIVMCSAWGREELCAHAAWRELAQRLNALGWPVLRFDYAGCGDAFDPPDGADAWAWWVESTRAAIEALKRWSGVERVALVGLRLGAAIAWQAAEGRGDVAVAATLFPVVSGRAYLRELRALQGAGAGAAPADAAAFESGGFVLNAATLQALGSVDLRRTACAAAQVLVIDRDDLPSARSWVQGLQASGHPARQSAAAGFAELMLDPHASRAPQPAWQAACEGLAAILHGASRTSPRPVAQRPQAVARAACGGLDERAVVHAAAGASLNGIETQAPSTRPSGHAIVLLNAGAVRRIGPNRMWVGLARRWARQGHRVLRLDLSGLGDSDARTGDAPGAVYGAQAVDEVCAVVEQLRERPGLEGCHVVGLCSGAYHGLKAAVRAAPLRSVTIINPLTFAWREGLSLDAPLPDHTIASEMQRYRSIAWSAAPWLKLLRGDVNAAGLLQRLALGTGQALAARARTLARAAGLPAERDLSDELSGVSHRGVRLQFVFSQGDPGQRMLQAQAGATVRRLQEAGTLGIAVVPGADHTFTALAARSELIELLARQMQML